MSLHAYPPPSDEVAAFNARFAHNIQANTRRIHHNMALKRSDSKTLKDPPPRSCVACTDTDVKFIRPCPSCGVDYCIECLVTMFIAATNDSTRMPPHCCNLIQIHTIITSLTPAEVTAYRAKFEEWITPVKTYCPSPPCSAFISEQRMPTTPRLLKTSPDLPLMLAEIIQNVTKYPEARFFRGELTIDLLPGYTTTVSTPMDLSMIQDRLSSSHYTSLEDLTKDMSLIMTNAKEYNESWIHPVVKAAKQFFSKYVDEVSNVTRRHAEADKPISPPTMFACPRCHIAICTTCKQIEHAASPCDTSAADHELAMLETFGYKQCPSCKAAVKKMFGCSHMECRCGAHWCYYCRRSLNKCDGTCEERGLEEEEEDEDDYDSEVDGLDEADLNEEIRAMQAEQQRARAALGPTAGPIVAPGPTLLPVAARAATVTNDHQPRGNENDLVNLDAGGGRRWGDGDHDFGEEPEDVPFSQVWSCSHSFETFKAPADDGFDRGDLDRMECNRCFQKVEAAKLPSKMPPQKKRNWRRGVTRRASETTAVTDDVSQVGLNEKQAWECQSCRVVVCKACKAKYEVTGPEEE